MKTTITFSVLLLISIFSIATARRAAVLDTDGDPVREGVEYYVVSHQWNDVGGELALGTSSNQKCPEIVVQTSDGANGIPVKFTNYRSIDDVVRVNNSVFIEFAPIGTRLCRTTTGWEVDNYDPSTGKWWLTTDGGPNSPFSLFRIEETASSIVPSYKFRFCPTSQGGIVMCGDVGRYSDNGQMRLALTNEEGWGWGFRKANQTIKATS